MKSSSSLIISDPLHIKYGNYTVNTLCLFLFLREYLVNVKKLAKKTTARYKKNFVIVLMLEASPLFIFVKKQRYK